ncbi:glycolate oxidase iron-sulfur subunit [Methylococcaceae bacterium]|nr:glycolate oxidase iron-sulfur subunit [Methylococcaceae bacterium]
MNEIKKQLLNVADSCVKCGICAPHCPTYTHTQNENESPRGRIALIQAWAGGHLGITDNLLNHIDNCLLCRACEKACPAVVPYGKLIDDFRAEIHEEQSTPITVKIVKSIAESKRVQRSVQLILNVYQQNKLQKTARLLRLPKLFGLNELDRLVPNYQEKETLKNYYAAKNEAKGDVGLFVGCMGELFDFATVSAAIKVLTQIGFNVHLPNNQTCCGALALHDGDKNGSLKLEQQNKIAFENKDLQAIVTIASGCGTTLREYSAKNFSVKVMDISHFLIHTDFDFSNTLKPLDENVRLHSPCSLKNGLRTDKSVSKLLQKIPELKISPLPETIQCCGAAGSYSLRHDKMAKTLLNELLTTALETPSDYLVSSNIGCALHIAAGLRERGEKIEVIHPIVLLARSFI